MTDPEATDPEATDPEVTDKGRVTAELNAIFRDVFEDPALVITPDMTADDVEDWDSARMVELIMAAEAHFGVKFTTRETDSLARVGDFIDLISRKVAGR